MAKDSDRLRGGVDLGETGGAFSGLLAEEDEFDRRTLWRLGTWAVVAVGAVVVALVTNQSAIGWRHEHTASNELIKQAQQIQLAARESQNETRRLASAIDTLNSDRDRLYSKVGVLEQGLDSVTGAIARQAPAPSPPQASSSPAATSQASANVAPSASSPAAAPSQSAPAPAASAAPGPWTAITTVDPPPAVAKPSPAPTVAPVAATAPVVIEKQDRQAAKPPASSESGSSTVALLSTQQASPTPASAQASGSLMSSKSMMAPPDPAAGKLIEPATLPKIEASAPPPDDATVSAKASEQAEPDPTPAAPELVAKRTEFGVDVGGANSVPGLRALWRGLLKYRANAALATLQPVIVIKENNKGYGMQMRLVAGPIRDAAAAAKICASLTVGDRGCTTTVFEGQRLGMGDDEKADAKTASDARESRAVSDAKPEADVKPASQPKVSGRRHYAPRHSSARDEDTPPKPEPSTMSLIFGRR